MSSLLSGFVAEFLKLGEDKPEKYSDRAGLLGLTTLGTIGGILAGHRLGGALGKLLKKPLHRRDLRKLEELRRKNPSVLQFPPSEAAAAARGKDLGRRYGTVAGATVGGIGLPELGETLKNYTLSKQGEESFPERDTYFGLGDIGLAGLGGLLGTAAFMPLGARAGKLVGKLRHARDARKYERISRRVDQMNRRGHSVRMKTPPPGQRDLLHRQASNADMGESLGGLLGGAFGMSQALRAIARKKKEERQ